MAFGKIAPKELPLKIASRESPPEKLSPDELPPDLSGGKLNFF
jgi:hypothetical protein